MNVYYNDIDPYCCKVLTKNIAHGNLPGGYVDGRDIRDVRANDLVGYTHIHLFAGIGGIPLGFKWAGVPEHIRILTGGFPCQDISNAGKRAGIEGKRSGLWKEMYRLICDIRPDFVLVENVAALLGRGIDTVLGDLAESGYDAEWQVLSAEAFGAPHLRERIFIVAYPHSSSSRIWQRPNGETWSQARGRSEEMAHTSSQRLQGSRQERKLYRSSPVSPAIFERRGSTRPQRSDWWTVEPDVDRVVNGIPHRVDRLRGLGNAVVPQIAEYIGHCIVQAHLENQITKIGSGEVEA